MAVASRLRLPTELLHMVCSRAGQLDLPGLALADKTCNEICTPLLYRTINLYDYDTALTCVRTLASDPTTLSFNRDLASLVRTFLLHNTCHEAPPGQPHPTFDRLLIQSVWRMSNIQKLRCMEPRECAIQIWMHLLLKPRPALRSVELLLIMSSNSPRTAQLEQLFRQVLNRRFAVPKLSELKLHIPLELTPSLIAIFRGVITCCASTLRSLSVTTTKTALFQLIVPPLSTLPALEDLEIQDQALKIPEFGYLSTVQSLHVRQTLWPMREDFLVPPTHWPALRELACFPDLVSAFLPPEAETHRPISTLRLAHASYEHNGGEYSVDVTPFWGDNLDGVSYATYSTMPLLHFAFQADKLNLARFQKLLPYIPSLESLEVILTTCPKPDDVFALGEAIIAHLPRLHTLLISDVAYKYGGQNHGFGFARDLALQRLWLVEFAKHSSRLRHVAFTTEFEWEKGADGAWYPTELPRNRPVDFAENAEDDSDDSLEPDDEDSDGIGSIEEHGGDFEEGDGAPGGEN